MIIQLIFEIIHYFLYIHKSVFLFNPKITYPTFIYKMDNFIEGFAIQFRIRKSELKRLLNKVNIKIPNYEIHKNMKHSVIKMQI